MAAAPDLTVGRPGIPQVDADPSAPGPELVEDLVVDDAPHVDEAMVRTLVSGLGGVVAASPVADDDVEDHWRFTDRELDDLVPPLTRVINRRPQLRRAVAKGDEAAIAFVLGTYLNRNVSAAAAARKDRHERDREAGLAAGGVHPDGTRPAQGDGPDGVDGGGVRVAPGRGLL